MGSSVFDKVGEALADELKEATETGESAESTDDAEANETPGDGETTDATESTKATKTSENVEVAEDTEGTESTGTTGTTETIGGNEGTVGQTPGMVGRFPDAVVYTLGILVIVLTAAVVFLALQQSKRPKRPTRRKRTSERQGSGKRDSSAEKSERASRPKTAPKPAPEPEPEPAPRSALEVVEEEIGDTVAPDNVNDMPIDAIIGIGKLHGQGARDQQQDSFGVSDASMAVTHGQLAVVCDGMGGLENGAAVSSIAVETILDRFLLLPPDADPLHALESLVVDANMAVNAMLGPDGIRVCGSTLVMALVRDGYLSFVSIGDSRICLYRDHALMQLNREHDYVGDLVVKAINGDISLYDALSDDQGHALVSYLGMGRISAVDVPCAPLALRHGDVVILMSDGVYNALTDVEISRALDLGDPKGAAQALGTAIEAKAFEHQDNYTAVVMAI